MAQKLPIAYSKYDSTRLDADVQRKINLYNNSRRGVRQLPGLVKFTGLLLLTFNNKLSTASQNTNPHSMRWNDGTNLTPGARFFIMDQNTSQCEQWGVGLLWTVSTGGYQTAKSVTRNVGGSGPTSNPLIIAFQSDGLALYMSSEGNIGEMFVEKWTLSAPWSINAANFTASIDISASMTLIGTGDMKPDGTRMFIYDQTSGFLRQYSMSTAGDVTTLAIDGAAFISLGTGIGGIFLSADGLTVYVADDTNLQLKEYILATAWDLTGGTLSVTVSISDDVSQVNGLALGNSETVIDVVGWGVPSAPNIVQYDNSTSAGVAISRGADVMNGIPYLVLNTSLYSVDSAGAVLELSNLVAGTDTVGMSNDGTNLVITAGTTKYNYTVAAGLVEITSTVLGDAYTSGYLDLRFYYDQDAGLFRASEQSQPGNLDPLDKATAESMNDDILAVFRHNQLLYICGQTTIEIWFSSQVGRPPVDRQKVIERGLIGRRAINSIDNTIYFLDDKRRPNLMRELDYEPMPITALGEEWNSYATVSDCIVSTFSWEQENFAEYYFPTADVSWTYHENSQQWTKRESSGSIFRCKFYVEAYGLLLGIDHGNGLIYQFSDTVYQENGTAITRTIDSDLFTAEAFEVEADSMIVSQLSLTISAETGGGTVDVSLTIDPGDLTPTFVDVRTITLEAGTQTYDLWRWGRLREGVFRMTTTSDDKIEFIDIAAKAELIYD